jgi:osmotically-inducible protein OsmY
VRISDRLLHRKVLAELESEPCLRNHEIELAVQEGVATLSGFVDSYPQKGAAVRAALRVSGVRSVTLALHVRAPGSRLPTDTEVALAAVDYLKSRSQHGIGGLSVKVEGGWITLEGEVELFLQKAEAEEGVSQLAGVRGVTNAITVRPPELVDDIKSKIEAALV